MLPIGLRIAQCRLRKGYTQTELASRSSLPQSNLSNVEKGKQDLTVSTLLRLAAALEVPPSELLEGPEKQEKAPALTRRNIEAIAAAAVDPKSRISKKLKPVVEWVRAILPELNPRGSARKSETAWAALKGRYRESEIQGICRRVQDALQRQS
jgi:transcriptional regulator with XRE-family HTH domain